MNWIGCDIVEQVPGRVSGAPIVRGTRVQADTIFESYELGESIEEIAYSYDIKPEDVRKVISFAVSRTH